MTWIKILQSNIPISAFNIRSQFDAKQLIKGINLFETLGKFLKKKKRKPFNNNKDLQESDILLSDKIMLYLKSIFDTFPKHL